MIDKYEFADSLGGVRDFFVDEAMKGSEEMKNAVVTKITVAAACVTLAVAAGLMAFFLGRGGIVTPANTDGQTEPQTSDTAPVSETEPDATKPEETEPNVTEPDGTKSPETEPPETNSDHGYAPDKFPASKLTGSVIEYVVNYDAIEEFVRSYAASEGTETDGWNIPTEVYTHTYRDRTVVAACSLLRFTDGAPDGSHYISGDNIYFVRYDLETEKCEMLEVIKDGDSAAYDETLRKYGRPTELSAAFGTEYEDFFISEKFWLYRPEGTRGVELLDRETGKTAAIYKWNEPGDPAGTGIYIWRDRYVFYSTTYPDLVFAGDVAANELQKSYFLYDIETDKTEELFFDGFGIWGINGDTLILRSRPADEDCDEYGVVNGDYKYEYRYVDLSDGIDSPTRELTFPEEAENAYDVLLSGDGRYLIYFDRSSDHHALTLFSYDLRTGKTSEAAVESEWNLYSYGWNVLAYSDEAYIVDAFPDDGKHDAYGELYGNYNYVHSLYVFDFRA